MHVWRPFFTLPNLPLKEPVEVEHVAIVPPDDPRCIAFAKTAKNFQRFLESFTDPFQRDVTPSVLMIRDDAPEWVMSLETIGGFRDAISIAAVTLNRTTTLLYPAVKYNQFSTAFEFYPWNFSRDFNMLVTSNPALAGFETVEDFRGQITPGLPVSKWDGLDYDETLLSALFGEWTRRFSKSRPPWRSRALFRSMNMAHAAAQVPGWVDVTSQSLGRSVALWVSACEILTRPEGGDAGFLQVYETLNSVDWRAEACKQSTYECYEGRRGRKPNDPMRTLACWIYGEMFSARNDYLHGKEMEDDRLVVKSSGRSLYMYTAPLYRLLLTGFLGLDFYGPFKPKEPGETPYDYEGRMQFRFFSRQGDYEQALAHLLKPEFR